MTESAKNTFAEVTKSIIEHNAATTKKRVNALRWAKHKLASAEELFNFLAYASAHYKTNSVSFLRQQSDVDYYDLVKVLKFLDEQSFGDFVVGRKGKESRITWRYNPQDIGKVGISKGAILGNLSKKLADFDGGEISLFETIKHSFHLRADYKLEIDLPTDFNQRDLSRLVRWLETIPFD